MDRSLYFAHPINVYGTELEQKLLRALAARFPGWTIVNPDGPEHEEGYQRWKRRTGKGMGYFLEEVLPKCHGRVVMPFRDGKWGSGVFTEAEFLENRGFPLWLVTHRCSIAETSVAEAKACGRVLSADETRTRIRYSCGEKMPY